MKPKALNDNEEGLLEYIEDIIGTQHYRPQIEVGLTAVDKLTEEREMHVKRVQQAEADREALEGAKLEAEEFLRLEVKLCKQRGVFIQVKKEAMGADLKQKEATLEEHQTEFNEKRKEGNELKKSLQEHEDNLKLEKKSGDKLMKTFEKEQDVYRKLDANTAKQHANLEHSRKTVEKSQAAKKKATEELTRSEQALASAESDLQENTDEHEALNTKLATDTQKYETQTEALQEKLRPLRASYEGLKKEIAPFADKVSKLEQKCRLLNKEKEFTKNDDQIRDIRGRIAKEQRNLAETGSRVGQYEDQIKIGTAELEKRKEVHSKENARLKLSSSTLPQVRAKEQQELAEVESLKKQLQELGSETAVSKALKRLKQQGGLDGYYGRLGDLGKIDDKYSAAVTSAGGGHLNALVVDGEATAQKILTYLKDNSIGRASTLLLDHQQRIFGEHIKKPFTPPPSQEECVRLYDMIEPCHEKFATAFYSAVRDTLVANSIDGATKLAFADKRTRHRVVTLKGELIEQTGTMTGGGRVPAGGDGMKSYQVSAEDQEQLRKKLEATQHRLEQANTDARQLSAQIHDSKNKLHAHQAACKETQNLLTSRTQEHQQEVEKAAQIEATLKTLSAEETLLLDKMKADEEKIRKIEETCHAAETELEAARNEKKVKDSQIEALEAEMDKTGGAAYTKLKQAIKTNTERCNELDKAISKATATINTSKKQITQRKKAVDTHEKTLIAAQKHLDSLDEVDEEDSEKIKEAKLKVKEIKKEIDEQKKRTEKVEKLRNQAKTALNDRKTEENKAQHELKSRKSDVDHAQAQIAKLTDTLNNIDEALRKSIDEYGTTILDPDEVEDPTTFDHTTYTVILPIEELETYDQTQVKRTIQRLEETQKKLSPNVKALAEWKEKNNVLLKRSSDLKVVSDQRTEAQTAVELLKKSRHDEFMTGFLAITYKLKEMYQMLTMGGDAELELVDTFDPFTEGLQFSVRPPKKSWKHISNLSGGEKTLSSLALVFALHHFKPTPLYVMDEIDAALDFKNVVCKAFMVHFKGRLVCLKAFLLFQKRRDIVAPSKHRFQLFPRDRPIRVALKLAPGLKRSDA